MSNATTTPRHTGEPKRRRSRGGKNRNKQHHGDGRKEGHQRSGPPRSEEFRPRSDRRPAQAPAAKPSLLQRLLMFLGLKKKPAPPTRQPKPPQEAGPSRPPKSNTRNARTQDRQEQPQAKSQEPRQRREKSERPRGGDRTSVESNRVYVGNLSYDVTEQDLQELFKGLGPVREVEIVYNRSTHRSKGYGFVEMIHRDEAIRAVEVLHDQFFMGRKMIVSGAKSKGQDEREDQESRSERPARPVVLAPLPSAAPAPQTSATSAPAPSLSDAEPTIQTIVESVAPTDPDSSPTETPLQPAADQALCQETPAPEVAPATEVVAAEAVEMTSSEDQPSRPA